MRNYLQLYLNMNVFDLLSAPTREIAEHLYVQDVMSPLLGSNHVDAGGMFVLYHYNLQKLLLYLLLTMMFVDGKDSTFPIPCIVLPFLLQ